MRVLSLRVLGTALFLITGTVLAGALQARHAAAPSRAAPEPARVLTVKNGLDRLEVPPGVIEAPSLSPRGDRLAVVVREYENELLGYKVGSVWLAEGAGATPRLCRKGTVEAVGGLETFFHPSFGPDDLVFNHVRIDTTAFVPRVPTLQSWIETASGTRWEAESFGLRGEVLEHPRLSPDGEWLTFYARRKPETRGLYVVHVAGGKVHRVSDQDDKHPVWSPDGTKILFHHQIGGDALDPVPFGSPERAVLGYVNLTFGGSEGLSWERVLLDPSPRTFLYHKHPVLLAGSDLVFFHGREKPDGPFRLMVRRLSPGSAVHRLRFVEGGREVVKGKHASTASEVRAAVFMGACKGEKSGLFRIRPEALDRLEREVTK